MIEIGMISADDLNNENFTVSGYVDFSELDQFYNMKNTKHTEAVVTASLKVLTDYCAKMETTLTAVERMTPTELSDFLRVFYTSVRRKCGESYAKRSMFTLRYGLRRHFLKTIHVDIANDVTFNRANCTFFTVLSQLKSGVKRHFVEARDFQKIFNSSVTDCNTPRGLQNRVFLYLMMNVCCGGRRNLRGMKKSHFNVMTDAVSNRRFVSFARDKTGNLKNSYREREEDSDDGNDSDEDVTIINTSSQNRMYATPDKPETCPVLTFEKYIAKLNLACDFLWQRPKRYRVAMVEGKAWYDAIPLGKNGLGNKMKEISTEAGCSKLYSNFSLKLTSRMRAKNGRMSGCDCSSEYYFTDSSDIRETTGPGWYGDVASSSDDDGTLEDEQLNIHDSIKQENFDGDFHDEQQTTCTTQNTVDVRQNSEETVTIKMEVIESLLDNANSNQILPSNASHATTSNGTQCPVVAVTPSGSNIHIVQSNPYPIQLKKSNTKQMTRSSNRNCIELASQQVEKSMDNDADQQQFLSGGIGQISGSSARQQPCGNQSRCQDTTVKSSTIQNVPISGRTTTLPKSSSDNPLIQPVNGFDPGDRQTPSSSATPLGQDAGMRPSSGAGVAMAMQALGDDELLQLQKDVLRMQKENLALERVKIRLEIAKLEAETKRLQSENRN
ncbi:uncharacterized protein [Asterias amurensis]|uniref:uncharacterized protein n=1 Tax=Asterias amurensis TaxID=7602 RepID=UPI003AB1BFCD